MATSLKAEPSDVNEQLQLVAGTVASVKGAQLLAPRMLDLQRALSSGAARTQTREAERLAKKYGGKHPRVAEAQARAERMKAGGQLLDTGLEGLGKIVETFTTDNVFHGYVVDAKGAAAGKHTVEVTFKTGRQDKLTAQTDGKGYFRIGLEGAGGGKPGPRGGAGGLNSGLMSRIDGLAPGVDMSAFGVKAKKTAARKRPAAKAAKAAPAAAAIGEAESQAGNDALELEVQILDPAGKVVYEDEAPPRLAEGQSVFRYYALGSAPQQTAR